MVSFDKVYYKIRERVLFGNVRCKIRECVISFDKVCYKIRERMVSFDKVCCKIR